MLPSIQEAVFRLLQRLEMYSVFGMCKLTFVTSSGRGIIGIQPHLFFLPLSELKIVLPDHLPDHH